MWMNIILHVEKKGVDKIVISVYTLTLLWVFFRCG